MSSTRVDLSPAAMTRKCNIASWEEGDISRLNAREKKRYNRRKFAIRDYFTLDDSVDEIASRYNLSTETLENLAAKCLTPHEDGKPWGYRALLPGARVKLPDNPASTEVSQGQGASETPPETHSAHNETAAAIEIQEADFTPQQPPELIPDTPQPVEDEIPLTALTEEGEFEDDNTTKLPALPKSAPEDLPHTPAPAIEEISPLEAVDAKEPVPTASTPLAEEAAPENKIVALEASEDSDEPLEETHPLEDHNLETLVSEEANPATENTPAPGMFLPEAIVPLETISEKTDDTESAAPATGHEILPVPSPGAETPRNALVTPPSVKHNGQLVVKEPVITTPLLPMYASGKYRALSRKLTAQRSLHRRRARSVQSQKKRRLIRIIACVVVVALLLLTLLPLSTGLVAYAAYNNIKGIAVDGVDNLLSVKSLIPASKTDYTSALNAQKLQQVHNNLNKAESDFLQLQDMVNRPDIQSAIQQFAPEYGSKLGMAKRLVQVGLDVSRMGAEMTTIGIMAANVLHSSPLAGGTSTKPLLTASDITNIEGAVVHALYYIEDINTQMSGVSLSQLPISSSQQKQLKSALDYLPKAKDMLTQVQGLVGVVGWLLGVDHPRRFLVQTMDRAELRPSGGFTGQYGILTIENGRMAPFTLQDVTRLDYAGNGFELNRQPPPQYGWMNMGNWGLRDANLSADYPTNAKLVMQVYALEGGQPVDGSISLTPTVISQVLQVTGPIYIPEYKETITAQNLEAKLHYYQQDPNAIAVQKEKTNTNNASSRKAFTTLVGKLLMDRIKHLQVKQIMQIGQYAIKDLQSRDLGIYFNNAAAEAFLVQHGYSGAFSSFAKQDGFVVVQSNLSVSKASQFVHTTEQDQVVLDSHGGATHTLTITLDYQKKGEIWGFDTYRDYIRVYAPPNAQFLSGDGFDTNKPLCVPSTPKTGGPGGTGGQGGTPPPGNGTGTGTPSGCGQYNGYFPSNARYCPNGNYTLGVGYVPGKGYTNMPINQLGAPTEMKSDLPGYSMWGGLTETPKNCISTITLSWYVPHVVSHVPGQSPYSLMVDKQGGYVPTIEISVDTSALKGIKPFNFKADIVADKLVTLPALPVKK